MSEQPSETTLNLVEQDDAAWLWDFDRRRIVWANPKAVSFWGEENILDLIAREFGPEDLSVLSFKACSDTPLKGPRPANNNEAFSPRAARLKLIPNQKILFAQCEVKSHPLSNDRTGLYVQLLGVEEAPKDPELNPDIVLARSAPVALALYDLQGRLIQENAFCQAYFSADTSSNLAIRLVGGHTAATIINRALADGLYSKTVRVNSLFGIRRSRVVAQRSTHPATGAPTVTIHFQDVEDNHKMWSELLLRLDEKGEDTSHSFTDRSAASPAVADNVVPLALKSIVSDRTGERGSHSQEIFQNLLNVLPWGVLSFGNSGQVDFVNDKAAQVLLGENSSNKDSIIGEKFVHLLSPDTQRQVEKNLAKAAKIGQRNLLISNLKCQFDVDGRQTTQSMTMMGLSEQKKPRYYVILNQEDEHPAGLMQSDNLLSGHGDNQLTYFAALSHDMRTPLNAIIGFSEIMKDERLGPIHNDRYKDYASDIHSSSGHLLTLVNDLLDFSKFKAGQLTVTPSPTDVKDILAGAVRLLDLECQRNQVRIKVAISRDLPMVLIDPLLIERALLNVLSNAVKFSPKGEIISLSARLLETGTISISVQDHGPGMSAQDIELAMEPFRQTSSSDKLATERPHVRGTGLGLPLAKALVEANKGVFTLKSQVGTGTTATISLPPDLIVSQIQ